jgi:hypothetical protein
LFCKKYIFLVICFWNFIYDCEWFFFHISKVWIQYMDFFYIQIT